MIDWDALVTLPAVAVFGEPVIYTPAGGAPYPDPIMLVYDEGNKDLDLAGGMGVNTSNPIVSGSLSLFPAPPSQGDELQIVRTGETFVVKDVEEDGKGAVKLPLNYAGPGL